MPAALVTGGSRGFGLALAKRLVSDGWRVVIDGRDESSLREARAVLGDAVTAVRGDVTDPEHRSALAGEVARLRTLDLLVNNASSLGPSPLPGLDRYPLDEIERVYRVNVFAPLALVQAVLPSLASVAGTIVNVSSDAAVEPYEGWGGYGSSKAALDQLSAVLAAEQKSVRVYSFDPGDMRTEMHQAAFPDEDISDRPEPDAVVPALMRLLNDGPPSGRYRAADLLVTSAGAGA